jgi:predicted metal-dependent phosphoesterase TrpH
LICLSAGTCWYLFRTMFKVDLHTHSSLSRDGGLTKKQYKSILDNAVLDFVAITDHNETKFARELQQELGEKIIIGEEIRSVDGEIVGLYLTKTIQQGLSAEDTILQIHNEGGLVYIPHPFERGRYSLQESKLKEIIGDVDIIEVFNGRGFLRGKQDDALQFGEGNGIAMASSSDAHCIQGIGTAFSIVSQIPKKSNLSSLLKKGRAQKKYAPFYSYFCPSVNRIKNSIFLSKND